MAEMHANRLLIDLPHSGHGTSAGFIAKAREPVVFSHANAFAICPSPRNKPDDLIRAVADKGALIGAVMWSPAVKHATRPDLNDCLDHIDHMAKVGGIDHVGFASVVTEGHPLDQDKREKSFGSRGHYPNITGILGPWYERDTRLNLDYASLTHTPRIVGGLERRGYKPGEIEKIMSGNWLRVLDAVWGQGDVTPCPVPRPAHRHRPRERQRDRGGPDHARQPPRGDGRHRHGIRASGNPPSWHHSPAATDR
jgi:membrane dipeptidase